MRTILLALASLLAALAAPATAQQRVTYVIVEQWVEVQPQGAARMLPLHQRTEDRAIARYGPFRVLGDGRAALVDVTDARSPVQFAAMLRDYPSLRTLELVECPGTDDDRANLRLGRMIRKVGMATHVPNGGSVRSGAVELFLAGAERVIDDGAEFAVHSWMDENGREASDFAANAPEHRTYLAYYREMGMEAAQAERFYAMTNSVSFDDAKWLGAEEMRGWLEQRPNTPAPRLAYLDLDTRLP